MKRLPVGVADFARLRGRDYVYSDKTKLFDDLLRDDVPYFLSRPRRFGKTLLVSALNEILLGRGEIFKGLWIERSYYEWEPYPVIRFSMNELSAVGVDGMNDSLIRDIEDKAEAENVKLPVGAPLDLFLALICELHHKYKKIVAVLIDDYDAPILSNLHNPEIARVMLKAIADFYNGLEAVEAQRCFTFLTGVGNFGGFAFYSALNDALDLTSMKITPRYADSLMRNLMICFTDIWSALSRA
jgi:hypothetical protein